MKKTAIQSTLKFFYSKLPIRRREIPVYLFCYHKAGTILLNKVFREICFEFNWRFESINGKPRKINRYADIVLFNHSLVDFSLLTYTYAGMHFIRDPRDIIISGYLYHRRCKEEWCINTDFDTTEPIGFPQVPWSQQHRPENWKRQYIESLENRSYQENLLARTESEGILFEMNHYGRWTIESMLNWSCTNPEVETIRFENLMRFYDQTFEHMFVRFGFSDKQVQQALRIAEKEDINRKTDAQLLINPHISSREATKWREYFNDNLKEAFSQLFGDALVRLGYDDME